MRHQLFNLIARARQDLQLAEELAKAEVVDDEVNDMPAEDTAAADLFEVRTRVLALESRVAAIEERSRG